MSESTRIIKHPGGVLSDKSIHDACTNPLTPEKYRIGIDPYYPDHVQPSSYDVRLSPFFRVFENHRYAFIDPHMEQPSLTAGIDVGKDPFVLHPGEFVLGSTIEIVTLPSTVVARIEGKSSLGRIGVQVHATAGFVDPGFSGRLTLEISNLTRLPVKLYPGMFIGQVSFQWLDQEVGKPYEGKYQNDAGPAPSKIHQDFAYLDEPVKGDETEEIEPGVTDADRKRSIDIDILRDRQERQRPGAKP